MLRVNRAVNSKVVRDKLKAVAAAAHAGAVPPAAAQQ